MPTATFAAAALSLVICVLTASITTSRADIADFYRGKNLRILVGYGTGAGYDVYARLLGRHIAKINMLLQMATHGHPELTHVPLVMDYAKDDAARQAFALVLGDQEMGRPVVAPPDVPADRLTALRAAFDATMKDKDFLADAARTAVDIDPIDGKAVEQVLERLYATPKAVIERVKDIYGNRTQPK